MYYNDFVDKVEDLQKKYTVGYVNGRFIVYHGTTSVLAISASSEYNLYLLISNDSFKKLPYNRKLWMLASELTMTPTDERDRENYELKVNIKQTKAKIEECKRRIKYYEEELHTGSPKINKCAPKTILDYFYDNQKHRKGSLTIKGAITKD